MVCMCLFINIFINNKILRISKRIILGLEVGIERFIFSPISFIYFVLFFEKKTRVSRAGFKLPMQRRITLNFGSYCLHLPSPIPQQGNSLLVLRQGLNYVVLAVLELLWRPSCHRTQEFHLPLPLECHHALHKKFFETSSNLFFSLRGCSVFNLSVLYLVNDVDLMFLILHFKSKLLLNNRLNFLHSCISSYRKNTKHTPLIISYLDLNQQRNPKNRNYFGFMGQYSQQTHKSTQLYNLFLTGSKRKVCSFLSARNYIGQRRKR